MSAWDLLLYYTPAALGPAALGVYVSKIPCSQGITIAYTTFTPHFKGKRRYISGIIAPLAVLRNALMSDLLFSLMHSKHSQKSFDFFDETV